MGRREYFAIDYKSGYKLISAGKSGCDIGGKSGWAFFNTDIALHVNLCEVSL